MRRFVWAAAALAAAGTGPVAAQRNLHDETFRFASAVVSHGGLGAGFYSDPTAAMGRPARSVVDAQNGGPAGWVAPSVVYGAWNVDLAGRRTVVTVPLGGHLTVAFERPVFDDPANPWGLDFIVFGNGFLAADGAAAWNTDLGLMRILAGGDWLEPMPVSVSPDGFNWYTYPAVGPRGADGLWPTQAYRWDRAERAWGRESDFNLPVDPGLRRADVAGRTAADVVDRYKGSGGGTAYDLRESGFRWIRFIRFTGNGGEVDAVARVIAPPTHPRRGSVLP